MFKSFFHWLQLFVLNHVSWCVYELDVRLPVDVESCKVSISPLRCKKKLLYNRTCYSEKKLALVVPEAMKKVFVQCDNGVSRQIVLNKDFVKVVSLDPND